MRHFIRRVALTLAAAGAATAIATGQPAAPTPTPAEGDYVLKDFAFDSGERLPELRIHYQTLGTPHRGTNGHVDNAVLVLHGTGGTGKQFLTPNFAGVLFGPASSWTRAATSSSCRTASATAARASPATGCACASRTTAIRT
jgi:homoserine O-acetyltransferase